MAMTLVGLFDSYQDAEEARQSLLRQGLAADSMHLTSGDAAKRQETTARTQDTRGFFARLFGQDQPDEASGHYAEAVRRGSTVLSVDLSDDSQLERTRTLLEEAGATDVNRRVEQWKASGYRGHDPAQPDYTGEQAQQERETFKVMKEELQVGKRAVESGAVRVHRHMRETPVTEQVTLREERAVVERRPVDREATSAELEAFGKADRDILIRESAEEPVVAKTARVVEEVSVGKQTRERTETVEDTVRSTEVDVEQLAADRSRTPRAQPPGQSAR